MIRLQKPKDCICAYPYFFSATMTNHASWCPSHRRLLQRVKAREEEEALRFEEDLYATKDAYGRWQAGVGPKPEGVEDEEACFRVDC
jgi:hypothetical protein